MEAFAYTVPCPTGPANGQTDQERLWQLRVSQRKLETRGGIRMRGDRRRQADTSHCEYRPPCPSLGLSPDASRNQSLFHTQPGPVMLSPDPQPSTRTGSDSPSLTPQTDSPECQQAGQMAASSPPAPTHPKTAPAGTIAQGPVQAKARRQDRTRRGTESEEPQ